ncbi:Uncharacterised protein [Vibrio cholerae]|nr:Uncharacterised protein [Vibrio cholerae]CSI48049.1 Uncharacterised protein [Vibrio cholerae]
MISVGRKLVQPDLRLALCMVSMVSAVISSLNITPPQPFSCKSIKPGLRFAPFRSTTFISDGRDSIGQTASILSPLMITACFTSTSLPV